MLEILLLVGAGFVAASMNAVAGGGTFVTLPAMMATGLPALTANASSTVALVPGTLSSAWAYRKGLQPVGPLGVKPLMAASMAGGLVGAVLLLVTPTDVFDVVLPWLLLLATLMLAFGPRLRVWLEGRGLVVGPRAGLAAHFLISIYGGYFGGALGLIMMALWTLITHQDAKAIAPARVLMGSFANIAAVVCFVIAGAVSWRHTLPVLAGAVAGGYLGARLAQRLPIWAVRAAVLTITVATTAAYFWRAYG
jgi:uncharacterized protein